MQPKLTDLQSLLTCAECTYINKGSPVGKGPCMMCMHGEPHHIKVEVEDIDACPSPARKITGTVTMEDLMADAANLKASAKATTMAPVSGMVAKAVTVEVTAKPSAAMSVAASKKEEGMLESALKIIEHPGVFLITI